MASDTVSYCRKKIINYKECGHFWGTKYIHCHGDHPDTTDDNKQCWESRPRKQRNAGTTIETTDKEGGYCSRDCRAEYSGWHCCQCGRAVLASEVHRNAENNLVHLEGDVEHEFCEDCSVGLWV